jgi:O-phospho-L-seryl-tRNASec:L-selenocysteinyl-tRNA synthase
MPRARSQVLERREALMGHLRNELGSAASAIGQRLLHTPTNPISLAITLDQGQLAALTDTKQLGAMLWARYGMVPWGLCLR